MAFRSNSNIRSLAPEQEYEDQGTDDWGFIQNVVAPPVPVAAPVAAPAPAPVAAPDWSQGNQVIDGLMYQPIYDDFGNLQEVLRYQPGQIGAGQPYEKLNPTTLQAAGTGKFKEVGNALDLAKSAALDVAPLATFALGVGPLGGMLGGAAASGLGITGLSAAQTAALGSAIGGAANTALQGGDLGDVLEGAFKTALPSFVLPQIPSTGTPALDTAIKAGTQAAIRGGDIESAVVGSLLNSGVGTAIGETGLDPKLVNSVIAAATSGGDPQKLFNAAVGAAGSFAGPNSQAAVGGGAETEGFFDAEEAQAVQDDISSILARYPEQPAPAPEPTFKPPSDEDYEELESILLRYPEQQIPDVEPKTSMPPQEMARFLEANIEDPGTIDTLMQDYFPELYSQRIDVTGTRDRDLFPEFTQPLLTAEPAPEPIYEQPPTPAPAPAPPAAAPAPIAPPAAAPAAPAKTPAGVDPMWAFLFGALMTPQQQKQQEQYQTARTVASPFGMDLLI